LGIGDGLHWIEIVWVMKKGSLKGKGK